MKKILQKFKNEKGTIIGIVLLIMATATVVGLSTVNTTTVEVEVSSNVARYREQFYSCETGREVGREILEQNIQETSFDMGGGSSTYFPPEVVVQNPEMWKSEQPSEEKDRINRDTIRENASIVVEHPTNEQLDIHIAMEHITVLNPGTGIGISEGMEGMGFSLAHAGSYMRYHLFAQAGRNEKTGCAVKVEYRHLLGQEEAPR